MLGVFPGVIEEFKRRIAYQPTECTEIPVDVVEEVADRRGRFDGRSSGEGSTRAFEEETKEDLNRIPVLFAREAGGDVRIELAGTCILWIHTSF